jgi:hypothetical protein
MLTARTPKSRPTSVEERGAIPKTAEVEAMNGATEPEHPQGEPMGGLLAFQAFGIATAIVFGSAGLGAWGIAKLMGVNDVSDVPISIDYCYEPRL